MQDTEKYTAFNKLGMVPPLIESSPLSEGVPCTSQKWCEVGVMGESCPSKEKYFITGIV